MALSAEGVLTGLEFLVDLPMLSLVGQQDEKAIIVINTRRGSYDQERTEESAPCIFGGLSEEYFRARCVTVPPT